MKPASTKLYTYQLGIVVNIDNSVNTHVMISYNHPTRCAIDINHQVLRVELLRSSTKQHSAPLLIIPFLH